SEEHTSELQSHLISYAVFCLKKRKTNPRRVMGRVERSKENTASLRHAQQPLHGKRLQMNIRIFFFNDTATTEIYTFPLHDALPIWICDGDARRPVAAATAGVNRQPSD